MVRRMDHIVTLIGTHGAERPQAHHIRAAQDALGTRWPAAWLGSEDACDLRFSGLTPAEATARVRAALDGARIDIAAQPAATRRKRLLLADMDSTIIGCECIDEIADFAGLKPHVAAITEQAMRGELAFEPALRARVQLLKGLPVTVLAQVWDERVRLNPGARTLVATMAAHGALTALVSGGFTFYTGRTAEAAGFAIHQANTLMIENGMLTGTVAEPILGREAKRAMLETLIETHGLSRDETMAVGDGANDLAMIGAAGLGVAWHAKPAVAEAAAIRIDHSGLDALLYVQGIAKTAWVS